MFYLYDQNNSGGGFDFDADKGVTHHVIIEANSAEHADERAQEIGIYFNGVEEERDCACCGDRWAPASGIGDPEPTLYGDKLYELDWKGLTRWMAPDPEIVVHRLGAPFEFIHNLAE